VSGWGQIELEVGEGGEGQGMEEEGDGKGRRGGCTMTISSQSFNQHTDRVFHDQLLSIPPTLPC